MQTDGNRPILFLFSFFGIPECSVFLLLVFSKHKSIKESAHHVGVAKDYKVKIKLVLHSSQSHKNYKCPMGLD